MKCRIKWVEDAMFVGESGSGHAIVIDGPPEGGGRNLGMRPMELVLLAVGSCSAYDVVHILKKAREAVSDCVAEVSGERADSVPKVFTKIHLHFIVSGKGLSEAAVKRAIDLSAQKYCSASIMLAQAAEVSHDYEIVETGA